MIPGLSNDMIFPNLLILPTAYPGAFCIRQFEPLARRDRYETSGKHVWTLWRLTAVAAAIACIFPQARPVECTDPTVLRVRSASPLRAVR